METIQYVTSTVFSGMLYEMLSSGVKLSTQNLFERFRGWIVDEATVEKIADQVANLSLTDELNERAIERRVSGSQELMKLLDEIPRDSTVTNYTQNNTYGDNVMFNVNKK